MQRNPIASSDGDATGEVRDKGGNVPDMTHFYPKENLCAQDCVLFPSIAKKEHRTCSCALAQV